MTRWARGACALLALAWLAGCPEDPAPAPLPLPPPSVALAPVPVPPVATLTEVGGQVDLERDGGTASARTGPLFEGDTLVTGADGRALLSDETGRQLELGEDTRFTLGPRLTAIEVSRGGFRILSGGSAGATSIRTPYGETRVSAGSTASIGVGQEQFTLEVYKGSFTILRPDAGETDVREGERIEMLKGSFEILRPQAPPPKPTVEGVTLVVEAGKALVKAPGQTKFSPAKSGVSLQPGTAFQVSSGALRLEGGGARVQLAAGSSGVTEGVREESGVPVLALTKVIGPFTVQLDGKTKGVVQVGDVTVGGGQESTVVVTPVGKKKRLEVKAGEVVVTVNGKPTTVKAGDAVLVDGGAATAVDLKPGLVVNGASRVKVHADGVSNVAIVLPEGTARVEVARDETFASAFIAGAVERQVLVPGLARGQLYFRTTDASGQPGKQGRIDFLADQASARDTATRSEVVTEAGQKATVYYQSKVPALTFVFNPAEGARGWRFRLARGDLTPVTEREVKEPRLVLEPGVLSEGVYKWSASPLDANGVEKGGARYNTLEVLYDNARTTLLIERPLPGERGGSDLKAVGIAPGRSQVFVNGKPVKTDERGRFSVPVGGVDAVLFRVVTGETESYWLRRVRQ